MDSLDSRVARVCLTDKGKAIEESVKLIHKQLHTNIFKGLTNEEIARFESLLDKIQDNMMTMDHVTKENEDA